VTVIALILFWLFVSAIGNLFVSRSMQTENLFPPASPAARFAAALSSSYFVLLVSFYGVTALVAAVATWRMRKWMPRAFLIWSVVAMVLAVFFLFEIPTELFWGGKPAAATFVLGMAAVLLLAYRYIRRVAAGGLNAAP
jgi:uncharacterized membrane protein (DUF2068 family)